MNKTKVLITGAAGQLGTAIQAAASDFPEFELLLTDRDQLDITDLSATQKFVLENEIAHCINCAAYTAVDKAEDEKDLAEKINVVGARNLAIAMKQTTGRLIHISTDYVFDGTKSTPYVESDSPNPQGVYGQTKLQSEKEVAENNSNAVIVRTAWLYSEYGQNITKTFLKLGQEREELNVVFDQVGCPTYAPDLAQALLKILQNPDKSAGIYHYSNEGVASWYDFATAVMEIVDLSCRVKPIETKDYPTKAVRPAFSVFNKSKIKSAFDLEIPHWRISLKRCLDNMPK